MRLLLAIYWPGSDKQRLGHGRSFALELKEDNNLFEALHTVLDGFWAAFARVDRVMNNTDAVYHQ